MADTDQNMCGIVDMCGFAHGETVKRDLTVQGVERAWYYNKLRYFWLIGFRAIAFSRAARLCKQFCNFRGAT